MYGLHEQRSNLARGVSSYATAYLCDKESEFGVLFGKSDEILHCDFGLAHRSHCGYGVALSLQSLALSHDGTEFLHCCTCRTTVMCSGRVATKHEYLIGFQTVDVVWCETACVFTDF